MDYKLLADDVLLKLLKISDELAYKEIYLRYWRKLFYSAVSKTNSKEGCRRHNSKRIYRSLGPARTPQHN